MAWDCRVGCRLNLFNVLILKVLLTQIYLVGFFSISNFAIVQSEAVDCDSVHHCICYRPSGDDHYEIECPNKQLNVYPIMAKVHPNPNKDTHGKGLLHIQCDHSKPDFDWRLIRGLDLGRPNQGFFIARISIMSCPLPPLNDGIAEFLKHLNIDPDKVISFSFNSHRNIPFIPDYMMSPMENLIELNLSFNNISVFPNLSFLPKLKYINLFSNAIPAITRESFAHNKYLISLQVANNNIFHIEKSSLPESLTHVNLVANKIQTVTTETFSSLKKVETLLLSSNPLDTVEPTAFNTLNTLRDLKIDTTNIQQFPVFNGLSALQSFSISSSRMIKPYCRPSKSNETTPGSTTKKIGGIITENPNQVMTTGMMESEEETTVEVGSNGTMLPPTSAITNTKPNLVSSSDPQADCVFINLPSLVSVSLVSDNLIDIPLFENLPSLTTLSLARNKIKTLPLDAFANVLTLKRLDLKSNQISYISNIPNYQLVDLDLSINQLDTIDKSTFSNLGNLKKLSLAKNKITYIDPKAFSYLTELEVLDLSDNLLDFAAPPPPGKSSVFDSALKGYSPLRACIQLRKINLSGNKLSSIPSDFYVTMLNLSTLNLSRNLFKILRAMDLSFIQSSVDVDLTRNEIRVIDMTYWFVYFNKSNNATRINFKLNDNPLYCDCSLHAFKLFKVEHVTIDMGTLNCTGPTSPKNLTGLRIDQVDEADLVCELKPDEGCPMDCHCWRRPSDFTVIVNCEGQYNDSRIKLPNLDHIKLKPGADLKKYGFLLDLSYKGITHMPDEFSKGLSNRTRGVNLRGNKLQSLSFLKVVSMGDNNVTRFNLSDNPFPCDCDFLTISRSQFTRIWDSDNLTCIINDASSVQVKKTLDFDYESICSTGDVISIFVPLLSIILLIFVAATYVYVRHGWAIRAFLYSKGFGRFLCDKNLEDDDEEKIYDAFVSYCHRDEPWVLEELVNRLEEQEGFKLCLHFRDWIPGDWIPDQIVRSVDQSRRTVVILSKNFVDSIWSRLEFKAAHSQAINERSNRLILVLMGDDLTDKDVQDDDLRVYMKMNTYIKWNDPWFWHKLKYALPHRKCLIEENRNQYTKRVQRDRAIQLDKIRSKMENDLQIPA